MIFTNKRVYKQEGIPVCNVRHACACTLVYATTHAQFCCNANAGPGAAPQGDQQQPGAGPAAVHARKSQDQAQEQHRARSFTGEATARVLCALRCVWVQMRV